MTQMDLTLDDVLAADLTRLENERLQKRVAELESMLDNALYAADVAVANMQAAQRRAQWVEEEHAKPRRGRGRAKAEARE